MCLKRENRLTKRGFHKTVANADSTEFQKASPTQQQQQHHWAPASGGLASEALGLGGTESKISPIMSPPEEGPASRLPGWRWPPRPQLRRPLEGRGGGAKNTALVARVELGSGPAM